MRDPESTICLLCNKDRGTKCNLTVSMAMHSGKRHQAITVDCCLMCVSERWPKMTLLVDAEDKQLNGGKG